MSGVGPIHVELRAHIDQAGLDAACASLLSVFDVLEASGSLRDMVAERFGDLFGTEASGGRTDLLLDRCDLLLAVSVLRSADGALEFVFEPSDRYVELVAAISGGGDVSRNADPHGWPLLSLASDSTSVAEAGGRCESPAGGGAA